MILLLESKGPFGNLGKDNATLQLQWEANGYLAVYRWKDNPEEHVRCRRYVLSTDSMRSSTKTKKT